MAKKAGAPLTQSCAAVLTDTVDSLARDLSQPGAPGLRAAHNVYFLACRMTALQVWLTQKKRLQLPALPTSY